MELNMRQMIGQHLVGGFPGTVISEEFERLVSEYKLGNVVLFRRNIESAQQLKRLCGDIQQLMLRETGYPAFIMIDEEGGSVTRLPDELCGMPGAMAIAAAGKPKYAREAAQWTARTLKNLGVNFNLAPVMDVNNARKNPAIGTRSYGDQPEQVAEFGVAAVGGYLQEESLACAKHFPGHGDTEVDSHLGLPIVDKPLSELEQTDLLPFRAVIEAGVPAVMTAHILYPAIEPEHIPCTMSRRLLTGLLREKLGFTGLIVSDCTEMDAIKKYYGTSNGVVAALGAGADLVLICHTAALMEESAKKVEAAVLSGKISEEEMRKSTERVISYKRKYCTESICVSGQVSGLDTQELKAFTRRVREKSLTLTQGELFCPDERTFFVGSHDFRGSLVGNEKSEETTFPGYMAARFGGMYLITEREPKRDEIEKAVKMAEKSDKIVLCLCNAHLHGMQMELLNALSQTGKPMLAVSLKAPYDLADLPSHAAGLAAWDYKEETLSVLADFLASEKKPQGRLPVKLYIQRK